MSSTSIVGEKPSFPFGPSFPLGPIGNGFNGTEEEWLESLRALSNYEIAVKNGFEGTEQEWLNSLKDRISTKTT